VNKKSHQHFCKWLIFSNLEGTRTPKYTLKHPQQKYQFNLHSLDEVLTHVPENEYSFIILDSLNNMRIDAAGLQQIRKKYPTSSLLCITQSTKQGLMRGSQEIIHDCDIEIAVDSGIAKTVKNRFAENGKGFVVF
jgi:predicted ATP-dependent serine protease